MDNTKQMKSQMFSELQKRFDKEWEQFWASESPAGLDVIKESLGKKMPAFPCKEDKKESPDESNS